MLPQYDTTVYHIVPHSIEVSRTSSCLYIMFNGPRISCYVSTITTGSSNGLNNDRYCRHSDMSSWWWVEIPPETCTAICRYRYTVYCCILLDNYLLVYIKLVKSLVFQNTFTNVPNCEMEDEEVAYEIYMPTACLKLMSTYKWTQFITPSN